MPVASGSSRPNWQLTTRNWQLHNEPHWQLATRNWQLPRGFTFTEILFAVMILGIGFIMVAAIFPVAIQQTEANNQETIAASIGRSATDLVEKVAQTQTTINTVSQWPPAPGVPVGSPNSASVPTSLLVPTFEATTTQIVPLFAVGQTTVVIPGEVWSFRDLRDSYTTSFVPKAHWWLLWNSIARNLVVPSDPRFAALVMYKRDLIAQMVNSTPRPLYHPAPFAQVIVVGVEARNKQVYTTTGNQSDVLTSNNSTNPPTLVPRLFKGVLITRDAARVSRIAFPGSPANTVVGENAYVVVSNDNTFAVNDAHQRFRHFNGRIFRIGNSAGGNANNWELAPGSDLTDSDALIVTGNPTGPVRINADVLVVGRALDPNNPNQFTGLAQDVSVYSGYVQIPN